MPKRYLRRLRFTYWYLKSFITKYGLIVVSSFIFGLVFFIILFPFIRRSLYQKPLVKIGLIGTYTENSLPKELQNLISLGLTSISASGSAQPSIAESWKISDNGLTYNFKIKNNLYWQDGRKFKSSDINYNFKDVKGEVIDDNHYKFTLKEPFSPFLVFLSQPIFRENLMGIGIYKVNLVEKSSGFLKTLNLESKNNLLVYRFFPNESSAITAFKLGEVNTIKGISVVSDFYSWKNIKIEPSLKIDTVVGLFFSLRGGKLKEKTLRQALSYAVPDKEIKEVKAYGPISPISWAYNENLKDYNYDLNEANRLLEKTESASSSTKIVLTAIKPYDKYLKVIADSWRKLGIKVEERVENIIPFNFDVLLASQEISIDPDQYLYWHSKSDRNLTKYSSPRIDKLLEDGRQITDFNERQKKYFEFQKYLVEDTPASFLYYPTVFNVTRIK